MDDHNNDIRSLQGKLLRCFCCRLHNAHIAQHTRKSSSHNMCIVRTRNASVLMVICPCIYSMNIQLCQLVVTTSYLAFCRLSQYQGSSSYNGGKHYHTNIFQQKHSTLCHFVYNRFWSQQIYMSSGAVGQLDEKVGRVIDRCSIYIIDYEDGSTLILFERHWILLQSLKNSDNLISYETCILFGRR